MYKKLMNKKKNRDQFHNLFRRTVKINLLVTAQVKIRNKMKKSKKKIKT